MNFEQFANNGFLDWYYERFCFTFSHDIPILYPLKLPK